MSSVYFRTQNLRLFLITMASAWIDGQVGWGSEAFSRASEEINLDVESGFELVNCSKCPPVMLFVRKLFEEPQRSCFVDENQNTC
ncbi:hypothetical protein CPB84DRAFT_1759250 [Gymnopilus junonius]|uniref:Uncharacterized protein n=1 Tax=Gymnopilus junonius TaxID=109634 RepID=A0A9P5TVH4_GYMJU|nr:hypothetical protein CPB84DRAFT_1759250 [Gymnopilus junonius]